LLLYGMSMIYGATGTLEITEVARRSARILQADHPSKAVLAFGLVFVVSGLAFQGGRGAVPHVDPGRVPRRALGRDALHQAPDPSSRRSRWLSGCW